MYTTAWNLFLTCSFVSWMHIYNIRVCFSGKNGKEITNVWHYFILFLFFSPGVFCLLFLFLLLLFLHGSQVNRTFVLDVFQQQKQ